MQQPGLTPCSRRGRREPWRHPPCCPPGRCGAGRCPFPRRDSRQSIPVSGKHLGCLHPSRAPGLARVAPRILGAAPEGALPFPLSYVSHGRWWLRPLSQPLDAARPQQPRGKYLDPPWDCWGLNQPVLPNHGLTTASVPQFPHMDERRNGPSSRGVEAGQQPARPRGCPRVGGGILLPTRAQLLWGCEQGFGGGVCEGGDPHPTPRAPLCARGTSAIALSSLAAEMSELLKIKSPSHRDDVPSDAASYETGCGVLAAPSSTQDPQVPPRSPGSPPGRSWAW